MRVGVVGPVAPDYFAENVGDALAHIGHSVTQLGSASGQHRGRISSSVEMLARQAVPRIAERANRRIVRSAVAARCDVVINLDAHLAPDAVTHLRRAGAKVAFWFPDAVSSFGRQLMLLAPYDAMFFKEPHVVERLRSTLDLPVHYLPQGCNPRWHRPITELVRTPSSLLLGTCIPAVSGCLSG